MMTSCRLEPGTSTPCHSVIVPNRQVFASEAKRRTSVPIWSSPWHRTGKSSPRRSRIASAALCAARIEENSPSVRPPAARINVSISSNACSDMPSRPGAGRCCAT